MRTIALIYVRCGLKNRGIDLARFKPHFNKIYFK